MSKPRVCRNCLHELRCATCGRNPSDGELLEISEEIINEYAKEAEIGYDVDKLIKRRKRGNPRKG